MTTKSTKRVRINLFDFPTKNKFLNIIFFKVSKVFFFNKSGCFNDYKKERSVSDHKKKLHGEKGEFLIRTKMRRQPEKRIT